MGVYLLSNCNLKPAARYVELYGDPDVCNSLAEREVWVESFISKASADLLNRVLEPVESEDLRVHCAAVSFLSEYHSSNWVALANFSVGVAPSSSALGDVSFNVGHALDPDSAVLRNSMRVWAYRFRKKWEIRFGKLRTRSPMPEEELREKALSVE